MTDEAATPLPLPPPGWYPDPGTSGRPRWWDGEAWHAPRPHRDVSTRVAGIGLSVAIMVASSGLLSIAMVWLYSWGSNAVADDITAGKVGTASTFDDFETAGTVVGSVLLLIAAVLWCVWQYRLAAAAAPGTLRRGADMHAGSWFIPLVALWFPLQNMRDLWRVYLPWTGAGLLGWWWTLWLGRLALDRLQGTVDIKTPEDFRSYVFLGIVAEAANVLAAVLAVVLVVRLTRATLSRGARADGAG